MGPRPVSVAANRRAAPAPIMGPGQAVELTVPAFGPGNSALICFIPTEGEGTPHFAKGMVNELKVVEGDAPERSADATYRLATGRAPEGRTTLTAGRRTLKFEAAPDREQLEPGLGKPAPGKTYADLNDALSKLFEGEGPPPTHAAAQVPGDLPFAGFDLREVDTFYLALDFTPGTYLLVAKRHRRGGAGAGATQGAHDDHRVLTLGLGSRPHARSRPGRPAEDGDNRRSWWNGQGWTTTARRSRPASPIVDATDDERWPSAARATPSPTPTSPSPGPRCSARCWCTRSTPADNVLLTGPVNRARARTSSRRPDGGAAPPAQGDDAGPDRPRRRRCPGVT